MSDKKPFAAGDKITTKDGQKLLVVHQDRVDGPVLAETPKDVKPYRSTYYAADTLAKGHGRISTQPVHVEETNDDEQAD